MAPSASLYLKVNNNGESKVPLVDINDKEEIEFPVLRRSKSDGGLFVFSSMQKALCVEMGKTDEVGSTSNAMTRADDYSNWGKETKIIQG